MMQHTQGHAAPTFDREQRTVRTLGKLNTRIARLAAGLGLSGRNVAEFRQIMQQGGASSAPRLSRTERQRQELRALMVLRCDLMARALQDQGLEATYRMAVQAEAQLKQAGFAPGADGFELLEQLDAAVHALHPAT